MKTDPPTIRREARKQLSADVLYATVRSAFEKLPDHRRGRCTISLADALSSAFAMFSLKDPSLLAFEERRGDENLHRLYGIERIPSDTAMREILDPVDPLALRPAFNDVFRKVQRGKALEAFAFLDEGYLLALDGTGYFSSEKVHCSSCLEKKHRNGAVTYQHQFLGAAIVHPDRREVIPLAPEPIVKQDGSSKNDCERNAAKRQLRRIREEHPHLQLVAVEDGLASNAPHIKELLAERMHYILGAKPGDHAHLFEQYAQASDEGRTTVIRWEERGRRCEVDFVNGLELNESHPDLKVNLLQYSELGADGEAAKLFSWVTDLKITPHNARPFVRGGRARWKIENETFNTLKNQGYNFEHNYGHGEKNLSVVFAMLMTLAFLVDQVQQLCCPLFKATLEKFGSKRSLWEKQRSHFHHFIFQSWGHLYEVMLHDLARKIPAPTLDDS